MRNNFPREKGNVFPFHGVIRTIIGLKWKGILLLLVCVLDVMLEFLMNYHKEEDGLLKKKKKKKEKIRYQSAKLGMLLI